MWVRSALKTMTERSGQPDPTEALQRTLTEHSQQIQSHGTTLRTLLDRQQQTNQQLDQMASVLQHTLSSGTAAPTGATAEPPVSQQLPLGRDISSPNPERFSTEVGSCRGFLLQCLLMFNW
ncbi:hypothetical protein AMECASPLE_013505 [Ameca splendens]|uniref:Uncharacterized protein n=1 Tax=Ameca splendens TaxID=208324 RepID=A0ABV0ZXV4_9TELE